MSRLEFDPQGRLVGVDNKRHSLSAIKAKAYLVIFMCNHCPYVKPKIEEIRGLQEKYRKKGLVVIGINSNESENYPEDSFKNMQGCFH